MAEVQSIIESAAVREDMLAMSPKDFEEALDELSDGSERLPVLPPEALSRAGIYKEG
jgi:hypothetical protein